jgi:hypothetical protein
MLDEAMSHNLISKVLPKLIPIAEIMAIESVNVVFNLNSTTEEFDISFETNPELAELIDALLKE